MNQILSTVKEENVYINSFLLPKSTCQVELVKLIIKKLFEEVIVLIMPIVQI